MKSVSLLWGRPRCPVFVLYLLASEMPQLGRTHNLTQGEGLYTAHNISATRAQGPPTGSAMASENLFATQREKEYSFTQDFTVPQLARMLWLMLLASPAVGWA